VDSREESCDQIFQQIAMSDWPPTPLDRTQLIEMAINSYQAGSNIGVVIHDIEHNVSKIQRALGSDANVKQQLNELQAFVTRLKHPPEKTSPEAEAAAVDAAHRANERLRTAIAERGRKTV
jgi:outer membrane murein-binding lipoprotein Lpp